MSYDGIEERHSKVYTLLSLSLCLSFRRDVCVCVYRCFYVYVCLYVYVCSCILHVCVSMCVRVYLYVCLYVHFCVYVLVCQCVNEAGNFMVRPTADHVTSLVKKGSGQVQIKFCEESGGFYLQYSCGVSRTVFSINEVRPD